MNVSDFGQHPLYYSLTDPPDNEQESTKNIDDDLVTDQHALQMEVLNCTLGMLPGGLEFWQDMFLGIPLLADLQVIHNK